MLACGSRLMTASRICSVDSTRVTSAAPGGVRFVGPLISRTRAPRRRAASARAYPIRPLEAALRRGARVLLISGPTNLTPPGAAEVTRVESTEQMRDAVMNLLPQASIVIKTAAVSDYRPKSAAGQKIKRKGPMTLELEATPDILKELSQ